MLNILNGFKLISVKNNLCSLTATRSSAILGEHFIENIKKLKRQI